MEGDSLPSKKIRGSILEASCASAEVVTSVAWLDQNYATVELPAVT